MKRRLLIIAVCLLAGALVNVAVAWAFFAVSEPAYCCEVAPAEIRAIMGRQRLVDWDRHPVIRGERHRGFGLERIVLRDATTRRRVEDARDELDREIIMAENALEDELFPKAKREFLSRGTCGWPFQSLVAWYDAADGLIATRTDRTVRARGVPLPIGPVYPGLVLGSAFYALIAYSVFFIGRAILHRSRLTRGFCPKCAYPMGASSVCTECGRELPKRARTT